MKEKKIATIFFFENKKIATIGSEYTGEAALKPLQHIPAHYVALTHFAEAEAKKSSCGTCFCTHYKGLRAYVNLNQKLVSFYLCKKYTNSILMPQHLPLHKFNSKIYSPQVVQGLHRVSPINES